MSDDTTTVNDSMEDAITYAKKYLEDLLSFFGINLDVHATSDDEVIQLGVPSTHLNGFLIGQHGDNMRSLQYLVSTVLKNAGYTHSRVNVDVADYKKQRAERLSHTAENWVKHVRDSGEPMDLKPMNAADRRVIHQLAAEYGLASDSVGDGRDRHIVLRVADDDSTASDETSEDSAAEIEAPSEATSEPTAAAEEE